jgi:succinate dehydrogenase/fumarate reductase iron-sulfur protein
MTMESDPGTTIRVQVFRFDPDVDEAPRYDVFQVPYDEQETVLGVLKTIAERFDGSLAFRESCRIGDCLICTVKVNGKRLLACQRTLKEFDADELVIEPADEDKVIRDLVCVV